MSRDDLSMLLTQLSDSSDLTLRWSSIASTFDGDVDRARRFAGEHACMAELVAGDLVFRRAGPAAPSGLSTSDGMPLQDEHTERAPRSGKDGWVRDEDEPDSSNAGKVR